MASRRKADQRTPEGWPDRGGQFAVQPLTAEDLARWEEYARREAWRGLDGLGRPNWPWAVRCLVAELRQLRDG